MFKFPFCLNNVYYLLIYYDKNYPMSQNISLHKMPSKKNSIVTRLFFCSAIFLLILSQEITLNLFFYCIFEKCSNLTAGFSYIRKYFRVEFLGFVRNSYRMLLFPSVFQTCFFGCLVIAHGFDSFRVIIDLPVGKHIIAGNFVLVCTLVYFLTYTSVYVRINPL